MVHARVKDYVKYDGRSFEPVHIFSSGSEVTGKSYLLKVIYNVTSKTLLYQHKHPQKLRVFFIGATEISVVHIAEFILNWN